MKFKASTLILLMVALGLGGAVYLLARQDNNDTSSPQAEGKRVFTFQEDQVQAFTIKTRQQTLAFARSQRQWLLKTPKPAPADDASVAYLLNLLATARSDRVLQVPASQQREFGLGPPQAIVDVRLNSQATHRLVLGKPNFNHSALYAQADPPTPAPANLNILQVPTAFENAVNRPLVEWQAGSSRPIPADPD